MSQPPCIYCGHPADQHDHIVSRWGGGGDDSSNIAPACRSCNSSKGNRSVGWFLREHPEVLARVKAHQAGADVLTGLVPGEKPRAKGDGGYLSTGLRIEEGLMCDLKRLAVQRRCRVNDVVVEAIENLLALNGRRVAA